MNPIDVGKMFDELRELKLKVIQLEYSYKNLSNQNIYLKKRVQYLEQKMKEL